MRGKDMDDIELLRRARPGVPPYPDAARARARATLTAAAAPDDRPPRRRANRHPRSEPWRGRRLRWSLAATAGGLAVAVGAAVAVQQAGAGDGGTGRHAPGPPRTPAATVVDAAQVLSLAAVTVETRPAVHPRPHQWAYTKEMSYHSQNVAGVRPGQVHGTRTPAVVEVWMRFDGTREAALGGDLPGIDPHRLRVAKLDHDADETTPMQDYRHLAALPTDPDALVKRLCEGAPATRDLTSCVFPIAAKLLANVAMPPKLRAAFYRVLAALPHLVVKRDVIDLAGRHDLAVAEAYPGDFQSESILLDPHTYEYRGERLDWAVDPEAAPPAPGRTPQKVLRSPTGAGVRHEFSETIRLASGIVDRPGSRP